jgi:hypothetical protein
MNFQPTNKSCAIATVVALLLAWFVAVIFNVRESSLRTGQLAFVQAQQAIWSQQDVDRAMTAEQSAAQRKAKYANEMARALGGPIGVAAKDPALDIRGMLAQTGLACAPSNTEVSVTVDRFTEFDVAFVLHESLTFTRLAGISKLFLENGVPYVHSLRFILGNEVLAQLGGAEIDSVTNWRAASDASVEELLLATSEQSQPAAVAGAVSDNNTARADPQNLTPDQIILDQAGVALTNEYSQHIQIFNDLVSDLNYASQIGTLHDRELQSRIDWTGQQPVQITALREFFLNEASEMEQLLGGHDLDPLVVAIVKRGIVTRTEAEVPYITAMFDALSDYQTQVQAFLATMQSHQNEWFVQSGTTRIQFSTTAAHDAYTTAADPLKRSLTALKDATQAWTNYKKRELSRQNK